MTTGVVSVVERAESRIKSETVKGLLADFKLDCEVRNLSQKSIDVYFERLGYVFEALERTGLSFHSMTKQGVQRYIMSLKGRVSDETINGRLRALRWFFNFSIQEGL